MTTRMFFADTSPRTTTNVNGRTYAGDPNTFVDANDADVSGLVGAGGWVQGPKVGATAGRPGSPAAGALYIDFSLPGLPGLPNTGGRVIISDGAIWRDVISGAPV